MSASTLYTAMSGLEAASYRQALQANNLANVNTMGFRAQMGILRSAPVFGPAPDTGQADVVTEDAGYSSAQGALTRTDSPWNVALSGQGWLVTRSGGDQLILTRDGQLHRGPGGLLRDSAGDVVLGANQSPIS
ncbi:MAG TPA: flagellar hook-basal body complex protein, partial [Gammaproteobacteria bacterium]|nr:flagellar hook-basal body complex protein [Gammaproteobacteria bacterium]